MYLSKESKKKLTIISLLIFLATLSLITGKTLANTLIVTSYPTWILPYFYFSQAILLIVITFISGKYLQKSPRKFAYAFKFIVLCSLLIFIVLLKQGGVIVPFCISILLLSYMTIISLIAWNGAADIFDLQEFKRLSKVMQVSSTLGAITSGILVGAIASHFNPTLLLGMIFIIEFLSIFLIKPLEQYTPIPKSVPKIHLDLSRKIKKNLVFKYLALMTISTVIISTFIDYNLKLLVVADIEKQQVAHVFSMIFVISTSGILVIQLFCIDFLFRVLGSKKIIIITPIALLIMALLTISHVNFYFMVALFIVNDMAGYTTTSLSKNLYLNILPRATRILDRLKLNGTITPIAMITSSILVLGVTYVSNKIMISLILIIMLCVFSLYLAKKLIERYRIQLTQSLYLRRFNRDLINLSPADNKDIEVLLTDALNYPDTDAVLFGLQLLRNNKSLQLPDSLMTLLSGSNPVIIKEVARAIADRRNERQFVQAALIAFLNARDEGSKWYLALYLMGSDLDQTFVQHIESLEKAAGVSLAIGCLYQLKYGDLEQQIQAMQALLKLFYSQDKEQMKWFLYVLKELTIHHKEHYLIQFINRDNLTIQQIALQQIGPTPGDELLNALVSHVGESQISYALNNALIIIGDKVTMPIENRFNSADTYPVKMACIRTLSIVPGNQSEVCLMNLLSSQHDVVIQTVIAKYLAYRGVKIKISQVLTDFLIQKMQTEVASYFQLVAQLAHYGNPLIQVEINSRLQFIKKRVIYYAAAIIGTADILNSVPLLAAAKPDKNQQGIALELIDTSISNRKIAQILMELFIESAVKDFRTGPPMDDPWLNHYIKAIEGNNMDSIYTLTRLRKIDLFKNLAAETLQVLVECCISRDMANGEIIFNEGDPGDGLYIIDSGSVTVTKNGVLMATLTEGAYFGELALLADMPRFATITAVAEGQLFYIDKQDFDKITDEIPEIMKSINRQVIDYLVNNVGSR